MMRKKLQKLRLRGPFVPKDTILFNKTPTLKYVGYTREVWCHFFQKIFRSAGSVFAPLLFCKKIDLSFGFWNHFLNQNGEYFEQSGIEPRS